MKSLQIREIGLFEDDMINFFIIDKDTEGIFHIGPKVENDKERSGLILSLNFKFLNEILRVLLFELLKLSLSR